MKLIHYTNEKFELEQRPYLVDEINIGKPNGLWISVEGEYDWKSWCEEADFSTENLSVAYELTLKEDANILHLKTAEEVIEFGKLYRFNESKIDDDKYIYHIKWTNVREKYQGIIISPYQWECRLGIITSWYYGWDCASGCICDLSCIKEFKLIKD